MLRVRDGGVRFLKSTLLWLLPTLVLYGVGELGVRWWYRCSVWTLVTGLADQHKPGRYIFDGPLAQFDPVVGYNCIPGVHNLGEVKGSQSLRFRVTIEPDGYRATSAPSSVRQGRPELWIMGGSYTWGLGVSDEDTFSWIVQSALPQLRVRNFGGNGYGTLQALLLLRDAVSRGEFPRAVVVVYDDSHPPRNVAAPSFLRMMNGTGEAFLRSKASVPVARLEGGVIQTSLLPLFERNGDDGPDPPQEYQLAITRAILTEIQALCRAHAAQLVFANQSVVPNDPVPAYARAAGFRMADLSLDLDVRAGHLYRLWPVEAHPNQRAHREYANRLLAALAPIR